jgi:hypothetical protein
MDNEFDHIATPWIVSKITRGSKLDVVNILGKI